MDLEAVAQPAFYLVRHGAAEGPGSQGDAARRLTPEGRESFRRLVEGLRAELRVARVLASPFVRALETAQVLGAALGVEVEEREELAPGTSSGATLLVIALDAGPGVALVGHNPEIGEAIAAALGKGPPVPPGTIAGLARSGTGYRLSVLRSPA
jgi:phosphohistidine phosphatase